MGVIGRIIRACLNRRRAPKLIAVLSTASSRKPATCRGHGGLHENHLSKRVVPSRWSLKELACHLRRVQQVFIRERLELMLEQDNPELPAYDPDTDPRFIEMTEQPASETIASYLEERAHLVERLRTLTREQWHRQAAIPCTRRVTFYSLAEYHAHHEAHHVYQMYQRRACSARCLSSGCRWTTRLLAGVGKPPLAARTLWLWTSKRKAKACSDLGKS